MTRQNPLTNAIVRKIATVPVFLALAVSLTFSQQQNASEQDSQSRENTSSRQETQVGKADMSLTDFNGSEWWLPILEKENVEVLAFNNFEKVFEMGTRNEITDRRVRLENAFIILKVDNEGGYLILTSPVAMHWMDDDLIWANEATIKFRTADNQSLMKASNVRLQWNEKTGVDMESEKLIINMQSDVAPPPPPPPARDN